MSTVRAIVVTSPGHAAIESIPMPTLRPDYILVRVHAIALNPTDWKHVEWLTTKGAKIGCDYSGVVEEVGSKVTKTFKKGDRIAGFAHGGNEVNHEDGAFGEYIVVKGDVQFKIPENLSFEEAATVGVGISTVGQGLYQSLQLPLPDAPTTEDQTILIYGGSTATGGLAIQYAKLSGFKVVVTCSPSNFDYVKSLGADAAYDYRSPNCSKEIRAWSQDSIAHCLDCISEGDSPKISIEAMSSKGGVYSTLLPVSNDLVKSINPHVEYKNTLAYTIVGESFKFGFTEISAKPKDFEFAKMFWHLSSELLAEGRVKVHRPTVNKLGKGLEGALTGMQHMKEGNVSGEKLVYTLV